MARKQVLKIQWTSKNKLDDLPGSSGVYILRGNREEFYIGKAVNIKARVKNHFQQTDYKDKVFINQVEKVGFIKTDSEIEALVLEAELIKQRQPKHNVIWRDDKNFFYVGITKQEFPRVFVTHQPRKSKFQISNVKSNPNVKCQNNPKTNYVGPFVDGGALKRALRVLRRVFPFRTCRTLPDKPCLWYQLGQCPAPCLYGQRSANHLSRIKNIYKQNISNLTHVLQGDKKHVLKKLKKEMQEASKQEHFERAANLRDQILALENVLAHSHVLEQAKEKMSWAKIEKQLKKILTIKGKIKRIEGYDVSNIQGKEATGSMVVFKQGRHSKTDYRRFKIKTKKTPNDTAMLREVLKRRLKHQEWDLPQLMLIDGGKAQLGAAIKGITNYELRITNIKVVALAKQHNKLFVEARKKPLFLKDLPREAAHLFLRIRDEAHRFAIKYHKTLRKKSLLK